MECLFPSPTLSLSHFYQCIRAQSPISSSPTIHTSMGNTPRVINSCMGPSSSTPFGAGMSSISHWASICSSRCAPRWYQGYSHNQWQADNGLGHTGGWGVKNSLFGKEGDTHAKSRACYDCASWVIICKGAMGGYSWGASWNSSQSHWIAKGAHWRLRPGCSCSMRGHTWNARCSGAIRISE